MDHHLQPCGTRAAAIWHIWNREELCAACRDLPCENPGTPSTYQAHIFLGEEPCPTCQAAYEAHLSALAAGRAYVRLAESHSAEFSALLAEERVKAGGS